jgi:hypothetical protein
MYSPHTYRHRCVLSRHLYLQRDKSNLEPLMSQKTQGKSNEGKGEQVSKRVDSLSLRLRLHEFLLYFRVLCKRLFPIWPWEFEAFGDAGVGDAAEAGHGLEYLSRWPVLVYDVCWALGRGIGGNLGALQQGR